MRHAHDHNTNRRQAGILLCTAGLSVLADGSSSAATAAPECTFTSTPSGLSFCDTKEGSGDEAQAGSIVRVHYDGRLEGSGAKFDSSYDRGMLCFGHLSVVAVSHPYACITRASQVPDMPCVCEILTNQNT